MKRPLATRPPLDSTIPMLMEGYPYIGSRCDAMGVDLFTSRLGLRPATFVRGAEASAIFYGGGRVSRRSVAPPTLLNLLQDKGSVQQHEGETHHGRKAAFLSLMGPEAMDRLGDLFDEEWAAACAPLRGRRVVLIDLADQVLTRTVCRWSDIPLERTDVPRLTADLAMMVARAGSFGPTNWYAQLRRRGTERWAAALVEAVRRDELDPAPGTALRVLAEHRDPGGELLSPQVAAVELLNVLRPTLAVGRFIVFAALALHQYPHWRRVFASGDETDLEPFVQEVRRFYPFFPAVPGRVVAPFEWRGHLFEEGDVMVLDLYGTLHDGRLWEDPDSFRPERMRGFSWDESPDVLIAQGGGRHADGHRCPGEWSTVELLKRAVRRLSTTDYQVPAQDLSVDLRTMPALPRSGFVMAFPA